MYLNGTDYDDEIMQSMTFEQYVELHSGLRKFQIIPEEDRTVAMRAEYDAVVGTKPKKKVKKSEAVE